MISINIFQFVSVYLVFFCFGYLLFFFRPIEIRLILAKFFLTFLFWMYRQIDRQRYCGQQIEIYWLLLVSLGFSMLILYLESLVNTGYILQNVHWDPLVSDSDSRYVKLMGVKQSFGKTFEIFFFAIVFRFACQYIQIEQNGLTYMVMVVISPTQSFFHWWKMKNENKYPWMTEWQTNNNNRIKSIWSWNFCSISAFFSFWCFWFRIEFKSFKFHKHTGWLDNRPINLDFPCLFFHGMAGRIKKNRTKQESKWYWLASKQAIFHYIINDISILLFYSIFLF